MEKAILTKEEINQSNVSDAYKKAILNAYKYAQKDEKGYFFGAACEVFRYILGLTNKLPVEDENGIDYSKLVDNSAPWSEIDTRIVKVIIQHVEKDEDEYPDLFELSSWLFYRLKKVINDDFSSHVYKILQEQQLVVSEKEMILSLVLGYSVILTRNDQTTSFGKIALLHIDEILTLMKKEEESEAIYEIYLLLKTEDPEQFKNRFDSLLEDMVNSGTNGHNYAIRATERDEPEKALQYAKEKGADKYLSTAYRVCFYAKGDKKEHYKKFLLDLYQQHKIAPSDRFYVRERSKRILDIWGEEEGSKIIEQLGLNRTS